jgi:hypothetical protein
VLSCLGLTGYLLATGHSRDGKKPAAGALKAHRLAAPQVPPRRLQQTKLLPMSSARLPGAVQDAAGAPGGSGKVMLLGGLTASDVSTYVVTMVGQSSARAVGRLPFAVHDSAAVRIGRAVYLSHLADGLIGGWAARVCCHTLTVLGPRGVV